MIFDIEFVVGGYECAGGVCVGLLAVNLRFVSLEFVETIEFCHHVAWVRNQPGEAPVNPFGSDTTLNPPRHQ